MPEIINIDALINERKMLTAQHESMTSWLKEKPTSDHKWLSTYSDRKDVLARIQIINVIIDNYYKNETNNQTK